jgi:hypothetical protein
MSGPHSQHRTPNRPLIIGGVPVLKFQRRADGTIEPVWKYYAKPGGTYVKGRCVDYETGRYVATRHVLDYRPQPVVVSKHARGRTKPLSRAERASRDREYARLVQARKSLQLDRNAVSSMFDEI